MPCCTKVLFILIDILVAKETSTNAARVLTTLLEICVDKLEPMAVLQDELVLRVEKAKKGENVNDILGPAFIERAKPVGAAAYALERPEEFFSRKLRPTFCLVGPESFLFVVAQRHAVFFARCFTGSVCVFNLFGNSRRQPQTGKSFLACLRVVCVAWLTSLAIARLAKLWTGSRRS
jgi:hypothetical protein